MAPKEDAQLAPVQGAENRRGSPDHRHPNLSLTTQGDRQPQARPDQATVPEPGRRPPQTTHDAASPAKDEIPHERALATSAGEPGPVHPADASAATPRMTRQADTALRALLDAPQPENDQDRLLLDRTGC
jgi:hypothetical protein